EALGVPTFRWYWVTSWVSSTGDGMENVIRNVLVYQLAGPTAPFWLGMMVFAHWVPFTFFSLYGGVLADRYDNRKVQIVAQLLLMTAAVAIAAVTIGGVVTTWWLFGLLLLHGFAGAIGGPAQQTLIHSMVGPSKLLSAVSLNSTARQFSQVIGPAVAGFIVVAFGPGWGFLINALTFVPLLLFLAFVRVRPLAARSTTPIRAALRDGLRFVRGRPYIAALIGVEMLGVIFLGHTFNSFLVLFAHDVVVVGASAVLTQSLTNTKIQLSAPNDIRGRVMGAYTFGTQGMRVLNGPLLGGAAIVFGAPMAVAGAAAVVFAGLAAILARVPQL